MQRTTVPWRSGRLAAAAFCVGVLLILCIYLGAGCDDAPSAAPGEEFREIRMWINEPDRGLETLLREWERRNPGWRVVPSYYGDGRDAQKLLTAIAGGDPPQLITQDRFTVGEWASRGAFLALDEFLARSELGPEDFYESAWNEASYRGSVYGIPKDVDDRALYYNKRMLREAGLVDGQGNVVPPRDWDDLTRYAVAMTKRDASGRIVQLGFAPNYGDAWLYIYSWLNGGEFMSADGRTVTLADEKNVEALRYMVELYDAVGGMAQAEAFVRANNNDRRLDPFLIGQVAMKIDGNWQLRHMAELAPDLEFGVAPAPAPAGRSSITWGGGYSYVIPRGARHPEKTFELIEYLVSEEGFRLTQTVWARYSAARGRGYVPIMSAQPAINEKVLDEFLSRDENLSPSIREAMPVFVGLMEVSRYRPVTPVGQYLWDEHVRALETAGRSHEDPEQVLRISQAKVQARLDRLLEEEATAGGRAAVPWVVMSIAIAGAAIVIGIGILVLAQRRRPQPLRRDEATAAIGFLSPWLIGFLLLTAGPMAASLVFSFCRYDVLHPARWVGLANYQRLFEDELFWRSLLNTAYMLLAVPLGLVIGLAIALLLNAEVRGVKVYRTLFYLPAIMPIVAASMLWIWVLNPKSGLINTTIRLLGIDALPTIFGWERFEPLWLASPSWFLGSKAAILLMLLWSSGSGMIIWLAGLKGIPRHLYEAAEIDGAGPLRRFASVTLPMLTPYIFFNLVIGIIGIMQIFTPAFVMTPNAQPADSTLFYSFHLFNNAFRYFEMGYASALAWVLLLMILGLTLLQLWGSKRWVHYEAVT